MSQLLLVILAALIHDIGKFAQRAEEPYSREYKDVFLPEYNRIPSHWHVLYTNYFVENYLPMPKELYSNELNKSKIATLASIHHKPDPNDLMQTCISEADRLSSGWDRIEDSEERDFKKARLNSIFDEISLDKHRFGQNFYMPLAPLEMNRECLFPVRKSEGNKEEYKKLFDAFVQELKQLPDGELEIRHYLPWLLRIMEKYTWCIPSSTYKSLPDISLYDHNFTTASIAQALWKFHQKNKNARKANEGKDKEKFILFGGDLSGIQNFIFNVKESEGKGITKLFRARSFYLQALTKSVVFNILERLGLAIIAQIMDAGGKFLLLLPNTEEVNQLVNNIQTELDEFFVRRFRGQLSMSTAAMPLRPVDMSLRKFHETYDEFNDRLDQSKLRKVGYWLSKNGHLLDVDFKEQGPCPICEMHPADAKLEDETECCRYCKQYILEIGSMLPKGKSQWINYNKNNGVELFGNLYLSLSEKSNEPDLSSSVYIQEIGGEGKYAKASVAGYVPVINEDDLERPSFRELFQEEYPQEAQGIKYKGSWPVKTFSLIGEKAKEQKVVDGKETEIGRSLLGVLKADVDNLGLIFSLGLSDESEQRNSKLSLSRFASLSRMLNLFFTDYLVHRIEEEEQFKDTYVIFAGGDDLFLVGPWHQTIKLAKEIRDDFGEFCAENEDISISCGVLLSKPRVPIRWNGPKAEELLDQSKKRKEGDKEVKNGITLLGRTLSWCELKKQLDFAEWLEKRVLDENSNVTVAFVYRLLTYLRNAEAYEQSFKQNKKIVPRLGLYKSHALYDIARNIMQKDKSGVIKNQEEVTRITDLFDSNLGLRDSLKYTVSIQHVLNKVRK